MEYFITDRFSISNRTVTDEGYLIVESSRLARSGTLDYLAGELTHMQDAPADLDPLKVVTVYRSPEVLFAPEVMDSFKTKPITLQHPTSLVDSTTSKLVTVGVSKDDIIRDEDFMSGTLVVTDAEAVSKIQGGVKELSLGYTADVRWAPGVTPEGKPYDAVMDNIKGNHIAIVPRGRCGASCAVSDSKQQTNKGENMSIFLDGIPFECTDQTAKAVESHIGKLNQAVIDSSELLADAKADHAKAIADAEIENKKVVDGLQAKIDLLEKNAVSDADIDARVASRAQLIADAKEVAEDEELETEGKTDGDIKKEAVKDSCGIDLTDKSAEYIDALFDQALASKRKGDGYKKAFQDGETVVNDGLSLSERKRLENMGKLPKGDK